jgi:lipopolysaccharide biosynthesis glycosyltransferase
MTNQVFVGYDTREDIAYQVCEYSIKRYDPDINIVPLIQQELRQKKIYWREIDKLASTEFTFTRFLVPHLMNYKGWALFIDCDIVFLEDVKNLFSLADDKYAVMCVKHDFKPKPGLKMDGQVQTVYPRKNWSSVVLWNCAHPSNEKISVDSVNNPNYDGAFFHRFSWLKDEEIGELPCDWNWLVGWYKGGDGTPRAIHYTEGGPWFKNYRSCEFNQQWKECLQEMMLQSPETC